MLLTRPLFPTCRSHKKPRRPLPTWPLLILLTIIHPAVCGAATTAHDAAVELAKTGHYEKAIGQLEILQQQQPLNQKIANDLIVTYNWNRQYQAACTLFEEHAADTYPTYVQTAILGAYRNLQQTEQALVLVNILLEKEPDSPELFLYKGLLLVDKQELDPARALLAAITEKEGKGSSHYRLSGYLHAAEENWPAALADYQQLNRLLPGDRAALREQFSALEHARAHQVAADLLNAHPQFFTLDEQAQIHLHRAAQKLRWSTDAARDFKESRLLAMQALHHQLKALDLLGTGPTKDNWPSAVVNDLIVTLRNLRQMDDVVAVYEQFLKGGETPNYVKQAAAGAMLAARHPDRSRELYQEVLADEPENYQAQIGLFYSLIEEEELDEAYELIDTLRENEPAFQATREKKNPFYNDRYLDLTVFSILARYYGDQLDEAWQGMDQLVRNAPANSWLLELRGQISNSRSWYHQALADFHHATLLAPDSLHAEGGKVASLILLREFDRARPLLTEIQEEYPLEHLTKQLAKQWEFSRKPMYWADLTLSNSSGPELDGDGMVASAEIVSAPVNDRLYVDALYRYAWNEIIEGEETFERYGLGLDYHLTDWDFSGRLTHNDSSLDEIGGSVHVAWTPDDFWRLTLAGERFSVNTPLRALHHGIRADDISATIGYRWSEMRELVLAVQGSSFTDDNDRIAGSSVFRQRLLDAPRLDLDGRLELYGSANSRTNTPYYNPEHDFSLLGALHLDHVYFRDYDHALTQMIDAGYGLYEQKGYGSDWIGHIRYEQRYRFDPRVEMLAGVEFGRRVYDGQAEPYRLIRFMIHGKF